MPFSGVAPDVVAPGSGSGSIGLQMVTDVAIDFPGDGSNVVVEFLPPSTIWTPPQFDDFNLRSTDVITIDFPLGGTATIPAGSAVVVDAAHAGRWKVALTGRMYGFSTVSVGATIVSYEFDINLNDNNLLEDNDWLLSSDAPSLSWGSIAPAMMNVPFWATLAEGDIVWVSAFATTADPATYANVVLNMKYEEAA